MSDTANYIYFDNAATEKPLDSVTEYIKNNIDVLYGNPSSAHKLGITAKNTIDGARFGIASFLSCREDEIFFTGSGTESNNLAIFGSVSANQKKGNKIITTDSEHLAVLNPCRELERKGFDVVYIPTKNGEIDLDLLRAEVNDNTIFVSIMMTNNETGAIYDIEKASTAVKEKNRRAVFHCDAIQSFCKQKINLAKLGCVDVMSFSAHKTGGMKGVGALFLRRNARINPRILGGGQENGIRSSTENVLGIATFKLAVDYHKLHFNESDRHIKNLYEHIVNQLILKNAGVRINTSPNHSSCIMSITLPNIKSEIMLNYLSGKNIFISAGSACSENRAKASPKYVLTAYGMTQKEAESTVRLSFCGKNTLEEADIFTSELVNGINSIKRYVH